MGGSCVNMGEKTRVLVEEKFEMYFCSPMISPFGQQGKLNTRVQIRPLEMRSLIMKSDDDVS